MVDNSVLSEQKQISNKRIKLIVIGLLVCGLMSELIIPLVLPPLSFPPDLSRFFLHTIFDVFNLRYLDTELFQYRNLDSEVQLNFLNLFVYLLALVGAVSFFKSQQRESRLIRFIFSIVFMSALLGLLHFIIRPFLLRNIGFSGFNAVLVWLWGFGKKLLWMYLSYYVLSNLGKNRELVIAENKKRTKSPGKHQVASRYQRAFHFVVDNLVCILVFSTFIRIYANQLGGMQFLSNGKMGFVTQLGMSWMIYYPVFELIFGATPAKLLTETQVRDHEGNKIDLPTAVLRTLSRFVPFELVSFAGDTETGWHDQWTDTLVLQEKEIGIRGRNYLWFFPIFIGSLILGIIGYGAYQKQVKYLRHKGYYEQKIFAKKRQLEELTLDDVIRIKDADHFSKSGDLYLKVEEIRSDSVGFVKAFTLERYEDQKIQDIARHYQSRRGFLDTIIIAKKDLLGMLTLDYDQSLIRNLNSVEVLRDGKEYQIEKIERLYAPTLEKSTTSFGETLEINLRNSGWPATLVDIQNIQGDVIWKNEFPVHMPTSKSEIISFYDLKISCENFESKKPYEFMLIFEDEDAKQHLFLIKGLNYDYEIIRLNMNEEN